MDRWQAILLLKGARHARRHLPVGGRRGGGFDMGNQGRRVLLARLSQVHRVPDPTGAALLPKMRLWVMGGTHELHGRREVVVGTPAHPCLRLHVILQPHAAQRRASRHLAQPGWGSLSVDRAQQRDPIRANGCCQFMLCLLAFRETILITPVRRALDPLRWDARAQPPGSHRGEDSERMPQRLSDELSTVECPHGREHMGRIRPLLAPRLQQPLRLKQRE
jgi:hypothetical protein